MEEADTRSNEASSIFVEEITKSSQAQQKPMKKAKAGKAHQAGVFSPIVLGAKSILGSTTLNKIRGKFIGLHSEVIGNFVETHETQVGSAVSKMLFNAMDKNKDGVVDEKELALAFQALGFSWLGEKQISGIMQRADKDGNGIIDFEEYKMELPKTLRTNLVKLAKKNGNDMGKSSCLHFILLLVCFAC